LVLHFMFHLKSWSVFLLNHWMFLVHILSISYLVPWLSLKCQ
jgi:hypothetical protein